MSQDQTLFTNNTDTPAADQPQTLFTIGDRDYDAEGARTKIENADQFINTLKGEKDELATQYAALQQQNAQLAAQVEQATKLDEALTMFNQQQQPEAPATQQEQTTSLDVEALKAQMLQEVMAQVTAQEAQKVHQNNFDTSIAAAQKAYGSDMAVKLQERGAQLGMDASAIDNLAKTQPAVFNELFIPKANSAPATPDGTYTNGTVPTTSLDEVIDNWGDSDKYWSSQAKAKSLRAMEQEVSKLIKEGKIDPHAKNFF
ncbi:coil containing protein [Vibrio phage 275E43-1]|nr:coil containing protein [Vibrio phage 275E43-1]